MEYYEGIERQAGVQKKEIQPNKFLFFVPEGEKYVFCSNDAQIQEWCNGVKTKKVKGNAIKFVVNAAKNINNSAKTVAKANNTPVRPMKNVSSDVNPDDFFPKDTENFVGALNTYCQKAKLEFPVYWNDVFQEKGTVSVKVTMKASDGHKIVTYGASFKEGKQKAAREYACNVLKVKWLQQEMPMEKSKEQKKETTQINLQELSWGNPLIAMQEFCQKSGYGMPEYKVVHKNGMAEVTMGIGDETYKCNVKHDILRKNSAKQNAAIHYARHVLKIDPVEIANQQELEENRRREAEKRAIEEENQRMLDAQRKIDKLRTQIEKGKEATLIQQLENSSITKKLTDKGRQYLIQATDGTKYTLDIAYDIVTQEKRKYRETWDREKVLVEAKNVDMKTLTVGYQKSSENHNE